MRIQIATELRHGHLGVVLSKISANAIELVDTDPGAIRDRSVLSRGQSEHAG